MLINKEKLVSEVSGLMRRYGIDHAGFLDFVTAHEVEIESTLAERAAARQVRDKIPERNRLIMKGLIEGRRKTELQREFGLGVKAVADVTSRLFREMRSDLVYRNRLMSDFAAYYSVSENVISEFLYSKLKQERDDLIEGLLSDDGNYDEVRRSGDFHDMVRLTNIVGDGETMPFEIRRDFSTLSTKHGLVTAANSVSRIIWLEYPAIIDFTDHSWSVIPVWQAEEMVRSPVFSSQDVQIDGRSILRIATLKGRTLWERSPRKRKPVSVK